MLDSDGYPTTLTNTVGINFATYGGIYIQVIFAPQSTRPGNYVVTWDGNGTIYLAALSGSVTTVGSTSKTSTTGSGRYEFSTTTNNIAIGIAAIGSPRITNMKLFHVDDETALNAGEVFGTKFKARLVEGNWGIIRMLNWMGLGSGGANFSNATTWYTRKPTAHVWYAGEEMRAGLYCGLTTNAANAYTVSAPAICSATGAAWDGVLRDKTTVHVLFNANATPSGTCSLNVGGTGAKNILGSNSGPLSDAVERYPVGGTWQSIGTLVFDANLNAWIKRGGDTASFSRGLANGVPLELHIRLCGEVGAHLSIPVPWMMLTPATDAIPKFIEMYKSTAPSWMVLWLEGPNELWNPLFLGLGYANSTGAAYGWGGDASNGDYHNWYGKALSILGQIASFMFGGDRTKYRLMCGVQTGTGTSAGGIATSDGRLSSTKYVANTGGLQTTQTLTGSWGTISISASTGVAEAWRWITHAAVANYVAPGYYGSTTGSVNETALAAAFAGGNLTAPATYVDSLSPPNSVVTFTNGTPGQVNWTANGLPANSPVYFYTTGTLPSGVSTSPVYFVKTVVDPNTFTISTTAGGAAITMSGTVTGTVYAFAATNKFVIPAVDVLCRNWKTWAQSFGVQKMCGYEGGYSTDYTGGGTSDVDLLRAAGKLVTSSPNNSLGLLGHTQDNYDNFLGLTGGTFTAEFPSCFQLGGKTPSNNAWSVLEDVYVTPNPPQFEAVRLFNNNKRRFKIRT